MDYSQIQSLLGDKADSLLNYRSPTFNGIKFTHPSPDFVNEIFTFSDRNEKVLLNLQKLYSTGRLGKSGYLSIFPVDQGIEHSAGADFSKNPIYFDPENIVKLAVEAGCNGVASTVGALGIVSKKYADKIPFIVKLNHSELLSYPNKYDQVMYASAEQAADMGAAGVGATVYFGSPESSRQIQEVAAAFHRAHELGLFTILWCYTRNPAFKSNGVDYHTSADLTGQANHIGVTIEADIIKQKFPTNNGGFKALNSGEVKYGAFSESMYSELSTDHPIDLVRYQVANCYLGKIPMLNSGGPSGENDLQSVVMQAVINKRAGGAGLILGRKAFQRSFEEGVQLLNAVQDVYLCKDIMLA